jgi:hypothetical protein
MPAIVHLKELDGIIDAMVNSGDSAEDIMDACQTALRESLECINKPMPEKLKRLDFFRL